MTVEILVGDCHERLRELADGSVDAVVTDPPYGETSLAWDVRPRDWLPEVARVLKPTGSLWCFGSLRSFMAEAVAFQNAGWKLAQEIVWEKHNGSSFHADRFKRVHEHVVQFYQGRWDDIYKAPVYTANATARTARRMHRPPHTGHIEASSYQSDDGGPKLMRSVIYMRSCHGRAEHPTQKPEGIVRPLIEYSCPPGGVVLDPFAGSGTTLVVARDLGRKAIGIEISQRFCDIAEGRLAQLAIDGAA